MNIDPPVALTAELTHRCPLHCPYCSNPLALTPAAAELATDDWIRVIDEARELGVLQLHLSGGEPLARDDLDAIVAHAAHADLYTQLVTSGIGLDHGRALRLASRGLNSVQLSLQAGERGLADRIAGRKAHAFKLAAAAAVRAAGLPLILNVVLHRLNIDELKRIIELCESLRPQRLELASAQYHGWAFSNRLALLPRRDQLVRAEAVYDRERQRLADKIELAWVLSDYHEGFPKPCMGGWGRLSLTIAPDGAALPCPAARSIEALRFASVRDGSLASIWGESDAFDAFRGCGWMLEPCRSCERRFTDYGGCRCQAFALTGDARRADPVCSLSPDHIMIERLLSTAAVPSETSERIAYRRTRR